MKETVFEQQVWNKTRTQYIMAKKAAKAKPTKSMEEALWESCNKMRGAKLSIFDKER